MTTNGVSYVYSCQAPSVAVEQHHRSEDCYQEHWASSISVGGAAEEGCKGNLETGRTAFVAGGFRRPMLYLKMDVIDILLLGAVTERVSVNKGSTVWHDCKPSLTADLSMHASCIFCMSRGQTSPEPPRRR